jgi:sugar phosphate isomerase/epimerase
MPAIDLGFCWPLGESCTPEEGLPRLRTAGFDGIELWPQILEAFGDERWARALRAEGMRCLQLCPYFNFVAGPAAVEESRHILTRFLAAAAVLDCRRLRVFTGPPWGDGVVGAQVATEAQWQAAIDGLREFCGIAAKQNIELCLECHEGSLMENSESTLRLLRAVDHSTLTVNLQLPLLNEAWETSVERLGSHTTHIHIHNWTEGLGRGAQTFLADGAFDWIPALKILVHHFQRPLCLSIEHPDHGGKNDPWETATREGQTLRQWKQRLTGSNVVME